MTSVPGSGVVVVPSYVMLLISITTSAEVTSTEVKGVSVTEKKSGVS